MTIRRLCLSARDAWFRKRTTKRCCGRWHSASDVCRANVGSGNRTLREHLGYLARELQIADAVDFVGFG